MCSCPKSEVCHVSRFDEKCKQGMGKGKGMSFSSSFREGGHREGRDPICKGNHKLPAFFLEKQRDP